MAKKGEPEYKFDLDDGNVKYDGSFNEMFRLGLIDEIGTVRDRNNYNIYMKNVEAVTGFDYGDFSAQKAEDSRVREETRLNRKSVVRRGIKNLFGKFAAKQQAHKRITTR